MNLKTRNNRTWKILAVGLPNLEKWLVYENKTLGTSVVLLFQWEEVDRTLAFGEGRGVLDPVSQFEVQKQRLNFIQFAV